MGEGVAVGRMAGLGLAAVVAAALLPGGPAAGHAGAEAAEPVAVVDTGGVPLRVRPSAATVHPPVDELADGARLTVACRLAGERIAGRTGTTDDWLRIGTDRYVSAAYVSWRPEPVTPAWCDLPDDPPPSDREEFLAWAAELARPAWEEHRIPVPVTVAQAVNESGWGESALTTEGNAYFGIKCFDAPGTVAVGCRPYPTSECDERDCSPTTDTFRVYRSAADSFTDHGRFLTGNPRYAPAFAHTDDPDEFARQIHRAGYATAPDYADRLIRLMREHDLYRFHPSGADRA